MSISSFLTKKFLKSLFFPAHNRGAALPEKLVKLLKKINFNEKKIVGVILVSPAYQGYAGDLGPLIDLCHQKNLPVLVDEAHGAYFLFCENLNLPKSALISNADLVVHSLHKSLNGLTQTAALWYKGNLVNEHNLINSINLLQTTSPSSLLLSSCEESIKGSKSPA